MKKMPAWRRYYKRLKVGLIDWGDIPPHIRKFFIDNHMVDTDPKGG
jgi:hypothetical protein